MPGDEGRWRWPGCRPSFRPEYVYPHEKQRLLDASGGKRESMIGKLLIFERESPFLNRKVSLLFIREKVGD
jgi:hypothetical protein